MRYPGNDPENGPAYLQVFDGVDWHCAAHKFHDYTDYDTKTGEAFVFTACCHCGEWPPEKIND
jgi:hypothetical protein